MRQGCYPHDRSARRSTDGHGGGIGPYRNRSLVAPDLGGVDGLALQLVRFCRSSRIDPEAILSM